jgi:hypothetical protein
VSPAEVFYRRRTLPRDALLALSARTHASLSLISHMDDRAASGAILTFAADLSSQDQVDAAWHLLQSGLSVALQKMPQFLNNSVCAWASEEDSGAW